MIWKLEAGEAKQGGRCGCCRGVMHSVSGFLHRDGEAIAAYVVQWTAGQTDRHEPIFDLILGTWGDGTSPANRVAVCLTLTRTDQGLKFTIQDSMERPLGRSDLVGTALASDQVVDTPLAPLAYEVVEAIWLNDTRLGRIFEPDPG